MFFVENKEISIVLAVLIHVTPQFMKTTEDILITQQYHIQISLYQESIFRVKDGWRTMISAYILITMHPGKSDKAIKEMRQLDNVAKISIIAGEYDIVIRAQVKNLEELLDVTDKIQMIEGVSKTTTQIIEKEISLQ